MNTKRNKRWNGNLDTLSADFLKDVIEKMESYGGHVQFELPGHAQRPNYQVINASGKKIAFDKKNLLLSLNAGGDVSDTLSSAFPLAAVKAALAGGGRSAAARPRAPRGTTTAGTARGTARAAAPATPVDVVESEKYAYFKEHRDMLPEGISKHSSTISELMRGGLSAEAAFNQVITQHFD